MVPHTSLTSHLAGPHHPQSVPDVSARQVSGPLLQVYRVVGGGVYPSPTPPSDRGEGGGVHMYLTLLKVLLHEGVVNKGDSRPRHLQGKGAKTGLVRQTLGFLSLDLCNYANFDHL